MYFSPVSSQVLTVVDAQDNEPLEFASIIHHKTRTIIHTDELGQADFSEFTDLEKIEIRFYGYKTYFGSYQEIESQSFVIKLNPSTIALEQAVVSATKWAQSRQDVPARITSVTEAERSLLNPQTAADLLGISGEVFIQKSQQGGGSPMIRGFSTNRLLYTIDGVRMNTAIFRSGNLHNVISLDPFATESTEVFFGPGSIIYGSDAIGAVMSFQTLKPRFSKENEITGSVTLRGNTAGGERTGHAHINYGGQKWAGVTSFTKNRYGDLQMGNRGPEEYLKPFFVIRDSGQDEIVENPKPRVQIPSGYDQFNVMQKIRFSPSERWDFQYGFHYSETSTFPRYDRHIRYRPDGSPRTALWDYGPQTWMMNHLKINHKSFRRAYDQMTISLAVQNFEESRIDRNFNEVIQRTRTEGVDAYSANVDFLKETTANGTLYYGVEYIHNDVGSSGLNENIQTNTMELGPSRYPNATWNTYAVYATYQHRINPKSLVQGGLRYSRFGMEADFRNNSPFYPFPFTTSQNNEGALTASTGWVYTPDDTWIMHINASTGFRAPNVDDIGKVFDSEPGAVLVPNPNIKSEYAYNLELNVGKVIHDNIMVDLTGYYTKLENAIVRREFLLNGQDSIVYDGELSQVLALQNAAFVRVLGLQANIEIKLPWNLSFNSKLNIQKGIEETDEGAQSPSRHAPPTFGVTRLEYHKGNLRMQLYSEYAGQFSFGQLPLEERGKPELYAIDPLGRPFSPSWTTVNLKGLYQFEDNFSLSAGLENMTNVRYRTYSSGLAAPGINFVVAITGNF